MILIRRNNRRTEIDAVTSGVKIPESSSLTVPEEPSSVFRCARMNNLLLSLLLCLSFLFFLWLSLKLDQNFSACSNIIVRPQSEDVHAKGVCTG